MSIFLGAVKAHTPCTTEITLAFTVFYLFFYLPDRSWFHVVYVLANYTDRQPVDKYTLISR